MNEPDPLPGLPPALRRILDVVRRRIRSYVWAEGLALTVALLGLAFWLGMAADWLFEPSPAVRRAGLVLLGIAAALVFYRYLLRRLFVPISDSSAAAILERHFPALNEHLLTAVDVAAAPDRAATLHPAFIRETQQSAVRAIANLEPGAVFNKRPLARAILVAATMVGSILAFALLSRETFGFWLHRIALSEQPWPRRVSLEVVGFPTDAAGRRVQKLAQEDDYELLVHADTKGYEIPDEVEIRYRLADGRRGRDTMIRVGQAAAGRDDFQLFRYQFKRVASDMEFDVVGGDDRVRDLRLQIVDRPELFAIELDCEYPTYLDREPRRLPVTGGMRIPEGTQLTLRAGATKPLTGARIRRAEQQEDVQLDFHASTPDELRWDYGTLTEDDVLLVSVTDIDHISSRDPYRISLTVVRDEPPQVGVRLPGIGAAITPEAFLPVEGKVADDYGLERAWFEYQVGGAAVGNRPIAEQLGGEPQLTKFGQFDLRDIDPATGKRALELKPGQRLTVWVKAADRFDLNDEPRVGSSQPLTLEIVSVNDLLAMLERRELALRQRYEAIYEKMTDTRNLLNRVEFDQPSAEQPPAEQTEGSAAAEANAADASEEPAESPEAEAQRSLARRRLRVAGSLQNVEQSADEIDGIAQGFLDICDQLTNNRIDNPDLQRRLREQIAEPLRQIADRRMPQLVSQLKLVEEHIAEPLAGTPELARSIALADEILVEMKQVLDRMLELETYNEVVSLLRGIINDQDEINRRTKEQQKEKLRDLFDE